MALIEIFEARKEALDVHDVAELLKVSERHIYELAADGSLPSFRIGKAIRFDPQDVADWLRQKKPNQQYGQGKPGKPQNLKPNRCHNARVPPVHIWRKKVDSLEQALAKDTAADGNSIKKNC